MDRGTWSGNPGMPIYRHILVNHGDNEFSDDIYNIFAGLKRGTHIDVAHKLFTHIDRPRTHAFDGTVKTQVGTHWTHDFNQVQAYSDQARGHGDGATSVVLEAHHPGLQHVMSWDSPKDFATMEKIIVPSRHRESAQLEVPLRPNTPLNITAMHIRAPSATDRYAPDDLIRVGLNKRTSA